MIERATRNAAVLIDGENIPATSFDALLSALHGQDIVPVFRVFGDFSNAAHSAWLDVCRKNGIEPILCCPSVSRKNGTDMAMTIAAMDILAFARVKTIVLASDDADFQPLAQRLRLGGIEVIGVGRTTRGSNQVYSKWLSFVTKPKILVSAEQKAVPSKLQPPTGFREAVLKVIDDSAKALSFIGKSLRENEPSIWSEIGKGKLKKHIMADQSFRLSGDKVSIRIA